MAGGKHTERIPAEELTAYERWELPFVGDNAQAQRQKQAPEEEELEVKPLTAADLEQIRMDAYQAGFEEGFTDGQAKGSEAGLIEGRELGHQEGLAQGLTEGRAQGIAEKQAEIDTHLARLHGVAESLLEPIRQHQDEVEAALLNLVLAISRAVIKREVEANSDQVLMVVREALATLPSTRDNVRIYVNPDDQSKIAPYIQAQDSPMQLVASDDVMVGGCRVETLHSLVDHTNEKRFQKVVQQMLDKHTQALPPEDTMDLTESMGEMSSFHRDLLDQEAPVERLETPETDLRNEPEQLSHDASVESELPQSLNTPKDDAGYESGSA